VGRAESQGKPAIGRDAHADQYARDLSARVKRQAALPSVECPASKLDELFGNEQRMALAEVDHATSDLSANPTPKEKRVKVCTLNGLALADVAAGAGSRPH
jgi:C4-dicarboxylate-specific signal transduction histidine kinase